MILQRIERILWPRSCVCCGSRCDADSQAVCLPCLDDLPWRTELCTGDAAPLDVAAALFEYAFPVDAALKALKFRRRLDYVPAFAALLTRALPHLPEDIDALLPVPLHWRRHLQRGFNQAVELCSDMRSSTGLPVLCNIRRRRATPNQSGLDATARTANLRAAFTVRQLVPARHVLIVDDVITTGATCRELARAARAAGAEKVSVLAVART
jgi:ComF family protein